MKTLCFAICAWRIGARALVADTARGKRGFEEMAFAGRSVVGHDPFEGHAMALEEAEGAFEERGGAGLLLVGQDFGAGEPEASSMAT